MKVSTEDFQDALNNCEVSNKHLVLLSALLSEVAYMNPEEASEFLSSMHGIDSYEIISLKRTQAVYIKTSNTQFIGFQGSCTLRHWISNFDLVGTKIEIGAFYSGFFRAAQEFTESITVLGVMIDSVGRNTVWCGHSRGGAIASIAAALLHGTTMNSSHVITFGAPKYSDKEHSDWINENMGSTRFQRYEGSFDPIAKLPTNSIILLARIFLLPLVVVRKVIDKFKY